MVIVRIASKADKLVAMQVRVLFFGILKDIAGRSSDLLALPEGSTLADVLRHYESEAPRLREFRHALQRVTHLRTQFRCRS